MTKDEERALKLACEVEQISDEDKQIALILAYANEIRAEAAERCEAEFMVMVANPDIDNIDAIQKLRRKQVAQLRAAITGKETL